MFRVLLLVALAKVTGKNRTTDRTGRKLLRGRAATQSNERFRRLLEGGMGTREAEEEMLRVRPRRRGAGTP